MNQLVTHSKGHAQVRAPSLITGKKLGDYDARECEKWTPWRTFSRSDESQGCQKQRATQDNVHLLKCNTGQRSSSSELQHRTVFIFWNTTQNSVLRLLKYNTAQCSSSSEIQHSTVFLIFWNATQDSVHLVIYNTGQCSSSEIQHSTYSVHLLNYNDVLKSFETTTASTYTTTKTTVTAAAPAGAVSTATTITTSYIISILLLLLLLLLLLYYCYFYRYQCSYRSTHRHRYRQTVIHAHRLLMFWRERRWLIEWVKWFQLKWNPSYIRCNSTELLITK